jgi:hypothetical protein
MNAVQSDRIGATRGKLALIGLLAVVLAGVVIANFRGDANASAASLAPTAASEVAQPRPVAAATTPRRSPTARAASISSSAGAKHATPFGEFAADANWPEYSLDELVSFDPFAAPAWNAPAKAADGGEVAQAASLQQLQEAQNAIILVSGNERVARIGSQEYRVGDKVGPYLITGISSAGIVLSESQEDAAHAR